MCKCSITSTPQANNASANNEETNTGSPRASPVPDAPVQVGEEIPLESGDDIDMVPLRVDEGDNSTTISQDSDVSNSTTQSHAPLLGSGGGSASNIEPTVEILPYSPQIEVNMDSLGAET